jgi:hypothetical protein
MKKKILHALAYHLPPIVWMILIFGLSSIPDLKLGEGSPEYFRRIFAHLFEYAVLWALLYRSFTGKIWLTKFQENMKVAIVAFSVAVLYAITDEVHQSFVPTRSGQWDDLLFDAAGAVLGFLSISLLHRFHDRLALPKERDTTSPMPRWPLLVGLLVVLAGIAYAIYYYNSYCPLF